MYFPLEIVCNIINFIQNPFDIGSCALACALWYNAIRIFGHDNLRSFANGGYKKDLHTLLMLGYNCSNLENILHVPVFVHFANISRLRFDPGWKETIFECINKAERDLRFEIAAILGMHVSYITIYKLQPDFTNIYIQTRFNDILIINLHRIKIRSPGVRVNSKDMDKFKLGLRMINEINIQTDPEAFVKNIHLVCNKYLI